MKVDGVGIIGTVEGAGEEAAREAAKARFGHAGRRRVTGALPLPSIFDNDTFSVTFLR